MTRRFTAFLLVFIAASLLPVTGHAQEVPSTGRLICDDIRGTAAWGFEHNPDSHIFSPPSMKWRLRGSGLCRGDFRGPWRVSFEGFGWSPWGGPCTSPYMDPGGIHYNPYTSFGPIDVDLQFVSEQDGRVVHQHQQWSGPFTLGVEATPFEITGDAEGHGNFWTRLAASCEYEGSDEHGGYYGDPSARFDWVQTLDL